MTQYTLSDDQITIRDMARQFAAERLAPHALEWDEKRHFPVDVIRETAPLGMAGIYVSEASGGSGLSRLDAALIFEALAEGCPAVSAYISIHNMVSWMIDRYGSEAQKQLFLPPLLTMEHLAAYCLTEPGSGSDAAALKTRAVRDGDHYVLNGQKQFISAAGAADLYLVMVRTGEDGPKGVSTVLVPKDTPGLSFGANEKKMGWNAQPTRAVIFDNARVPVANRLGQEGEGFRIAMATLDVFRSTVAAAALGFSRRALDEAATRTTARHLFGAPMSDLQLVQASIADMALKIDASALLIYRAAWLKDQGAPRVTREAAMAKLFATDEAQAVIDAAVQLFGGLGVVAGHPVERLYREIRALRIYEGASEVQKIVIARQVLAGMGGGS
jgi:alkylation response protein AidB-like acyl-CoA dehydrogenase